MRVEPTITLCASVDETAAQLIQFPHEYIRVGFDSRRMEFSADGRIEAGAEKREAFWRLVDHGGTPQVDIIGLDGELTCRLRFFPDGVWRGRWEKYEMMPVELQPSALASPSAQKLRTVIIQLGTGEWADLLRLSYRIHSAYAEKYCIAFWSLQGDLRIERSHHWNKIPAIQMGLAAGFEVVIWLDADTLIVRNDHDIRHAVPLNASIGMCRHPGEWGGSQSHFNTGVMIVRNTPWANTFLQKVWEAGPIAHPWHEQVRILECADQMPEVVSPIGDRWNCCADKNPCPHPVIRAWHGQGGRTLEQMRAAVAELNRHFPVG